MNGENVLKFLILADELDNKKLFQQLISLTDLKNSKFTFCSDFKNAEHKLKLPVDYLIIFSNSSSISLQNIEKWIKSYEIEIPCLILSPNLRKNKTLLNVEYYNLSKINPELLSKIIYSALEKQKLSLQIKNNEEKWLYLNSISSDIIWEWDIEKGIIKYNSGAWIKTFEKDYNNGKMLFSEWIKFIDISDRGKVNRFFKENINDINCSIFNVDYKMNVHGKIAFLNERGYICRNSKGVAVSSIGISKNITQNVTVEREVRRLSIIAEETFNGVLITDAKGIITWSNKSFSKLTGYNPKEILGKKPGNFLQGEETSKVSINFMSRKIKAGKSFKCDVINYKKSGDKYWVRIFCQPQFDEDGKLESFFSTHADISSEKEAHQLVLDNEKKYRSLIEYSKDGLSIISADSKGVDIIAGRNILGYSNEDYNRQSSDKYIHPEDLISVQSAFYDIMKDPSKSESREYRAYKKGVGYIWIESTFHNMLNVPSVNGIVANFRDINDRKLSEELLRLSEEKYRVLFNENPLVLLVWDPKTFRALEVNEMACKEYGYSRKEFLGLDVRKLVHPDLLSRFVSYANEIISGIDIAKNYSSVNITKGGDLLYVDIVFQPFKYFGIDASLAMIKNINEKVKLEMELSEEREENQKQITEAVLKAQEQERAHIGRELHDNINQILATSRLYIEYAQKTPKMHDQLLLKARDFILSAIQEIRSLSKSVLPPSISEVGLYASLEDLLNTIRDINHFKFKTSWKVDEDLLSPNLKLTIFRIIQEQLNNIIRHAKAKNVSITIKLIKDRVVLVLKDDGIGFEKSKKISGVGLKNIESRAALFNGTIDIDSTLGKGTILKVDFFLN